MIGGERRPDEMTGEECRRELAHLWRFHDPESPEFKTACNHECWASLMEDRMRTHWAGAGVRVRVGRDEIITKMQAAWRNGGGRYARGFVDAILWVLKDGGADEMFIMAAAPTPEDHETETATEPMP